LKNKNPEEQTFPGKFIKKKETELCSCTDQKISPVWKTKEWVSSAATSESWRASSCRLWFLCALGTNEDSMSSLMWMPQMFPHLVTGRKMGVNNYVRPSGKIHKPADFAFLRLLK